MSDGMGSINNMASPIGFVDKSVTKQSVGLLEQSNMCGVYVILGRNPSKDHWFNDYPSLIAANFIAPTRSY